MIFKQVGTNSWLRHFLTISDLVDGKTKQLYLNDPKFILSNEVKQIMLFEDQFQYDFEVEKFAQNLGLLSFSFVRHPFERLV